LSWFHLYGVGAVGVGGECPRVVGTGDVTGRPPEERLTTVCSSVELKGTRGNDAGWPKKVESV